MPHRQVSTTHSTSTFTVSRERQKPASSIVNPTCIPNTRNAAISVHAVLTGFTMSLALTVGSAAHTRPNPTHDNSAITHSTSPTPTTLPASSVPPYLLHSGSRSRTASRET